MTNVKDSLYTRTYEGDTGETVVVIGNRRDIADPVTEVVEAEFIFRNGELLTAHVLRFKQEIADGKVQPYSVEPPRRA
jgi:hypothetical protein